MNFLGLGKGMNFYFARARAHAFENLKIQVVFSALLILPMVSQAAPLTFDQAAHDLTGSDIAKKYAAIYALQNFRIQGAAGLLATELASEKDSHVIAAILTSLTSLRDPDTVKTIAPLLSDKNSFVRQRAANAIGLIGGPDAEPAILPALAKEKHLHVRTTELQALSLCGSARSLAVISSALNDSSPVVRAHAIQALRRIPGPSSLQKLQSLNEKDPELLKRIREAIAEKIKGAS